MECQGYHVSGGGGNPEGVLHMDFPECRKIYDVLQTHFNAIRPNNSILVMWWILSSQGMNLTVNNKGNIQLSELHRTLFSACLPS